MRLKILTRYQVANQRWHRRIADCGKRRHSPDAVADHAPELRFIEFSSDCCKRGKLRRAALQILSVTTRAVAFIQAFAAQGSFLRAFDQPQNAGNLTGVDIK